MSDGMFVYATQCAAKRTRSQTCDAAARFLSPHLDRSVPRSSSTAAAHVHLPMATVEEALTFSARLRMGQSLPRRRLQQVVDLILGLLELDTVAHRLVGTLSRGASVAAQPNRGFRRSR